jgi:hypothetical protein
MNRAMRRASARRQRFNHQEEPRFLCTWCAAEGFAVQALWEGRRPEGVDGLTFDPTPTAGNAVTYSCDRHRQSYADSGWVLRPFGMFPTVRAKDLELSIMERLGP